MIQLSFIRSILNWKTYIALLIVVFSAFTIWHYSEIDDAFEKGKEVATAKYLVEINRLNAENSDFIDLISETKER